MRVIIYANGEVSEPVPPMARPESGDMLIAADGGTRHCRSLGLTPDAVIGDLDSADPDYIESLENRGVKIDRHLTRKDYTDLESAIKFAVENGASEIIVAGGFGGRMDMTISNVMLLAPMEKSSARLVFVDGNTEVSLIKAGEGTFFKGNKGDTLSLIPIGGTVEGVYLEGLEYPLNNATLPLGSTWGISNVFEGEECSVIYGSGLLICVVIHKNPTVKESTG